MSSVHGDTAITSFSVMNESVTQILNSLENGDSSRSEDLIPHVYQELRRLAAVRMAREQPGQTLQPTALVHEAYLRLVGPENPQRWNSRGHFFAAAAEAMRRVLVERARQKRAKKYGGDMVRVDLAHIDVAFHADDERLIEIDDAITRLGEKDEQAASLIKLRFFTGMTNAEAARSLGLAERTANRVWAYARAWLFTELSKTNKET